IPIMLPGNTQRCYVVLFEELLPPLTSEKGQGAKPFPRSPRERGTVPTSDSEQIREISRLSQELAATKAYLQSVIEAKEAGNEELKAANEEIISSNEELQSTNEELETAKEELQATNEELATVNDELHDRIRVATQVNDDLSNLIDSVNIPILMLGQDLRLRRFSPSAQKLLNLRPGDIGRHISDFKPKISVSDLVPLVHDVLDRLITEEPHLTDASWRWATLSIRAYRTADNKIDGAVVSLIDIDALKRKENQIVADRDFARNVIEALRSALVVLDEGLHVRFANRAFHELFQVAPEETESAPILSLGGGQWDVAPLRTLLNELASKTDVLRDFRVECDLPRVGRRVLLINARRTDSQIGSVISPLIVLFLEDLTDREDAERSQQRTEARMQAVVETAADAVFTFDAEGVVESVNRAGEAMFGLPASDVIGQPLGRLLAPPFSHEFAAALKPYLEKGPGPTRPAGRVIVGRRKDGSTFPVEMAVSRVATGDGRLFTALLRDISERRELEREVLEISSFERQQIGQDLHDTTGQVLSGLSYLARGLAAGLKEKGAAEAET